MEESVGVGVFLKIAAATSLPSLFITLNVLKADLYNNNIYVYTHNVKRIRK